MTDKPETVTDGHGMPDVIYGWCCFGLGETAHYGPSPVKGNVRHTKYLRAEPVEALLKQARNALEDATPFIGWMPADPDALRKAMDEAITAIDEFLGEDK